MTLTRRKKTQEATSSQNAADGALAAANGAHARANGAHLPTVFKNNMAASRRSRMMELFGFELSDVSRVSSFVKMLNRPTDPSSLGIMRILFGLLMLLDVFHERGMHMAEHDYGDPLQCRFPLFSFLAPLPLEWMYVVFLALILGALGIVLGLLYRWSCLLFAAAYWYLFLMDKTTWNNHSYLYGLCALLLLLTDANRYGSLDGWLWSRMRNAHIPLWNYTLFRAQFFLVYFIAGLKKLDHDWVQGYSMNRLSAHWIFTPFTYVLSHEAIDLLIVHHGGLCLDLSAGFLLFFDATRPAGFLFTGMFHVMNSRMFSIGMFPYAMLATMPIFSHADWPKTLYARIWKLFGMSSSPSECQRNPHCFYGDSLKPVIIKEGDKRKSSVAEQDLGAGRKDSSAGKEKSGAGEKPTARHRLAALCVVLYLALQCALPYSHSLTQGYNNWTEGLYGYSWDMMVHTWSTQHVTISYRDKDTGKTGYLKPEAWTRSGTRWVAHNDMTKQYATCIAERLRHFNITNVQLYFDVWRSLNDRFQQRLYNPGVDLVAAEWHPFRRTPWVMPLLSELSDWRGKLDSIEKEIYSSNNDTDVVFIADFPGLELVNFVQEDLGNTSLHVLSGEVEVDLPDQQTTQRVKAEHKIQLPAGAFHHVRTVSETPSCFMYLFKNTTEVEISDRVKDAEQKLRDGTLTEDKLDAEVKDTRAKIKQSKEDLAKVQSQTIFTETLKLVSKKYADIYRSMTMLRIALRSIVTGEEFERVFNSTLLDDS